MFRLRGRVSVAHSGAEDYSARAISAAADRETGLYWNFHWNSRLFVAALVGGPDRVCGSREGKPALAEARSPGGRLFAAAPDPRGWGAPAALAEAAKWVQVKSSEADSEIWEEAAAAEEARVTAWVPGWAGVFPASRARVAALLRFGPS